VQEVAARRARRAAARPGGRVRSALRDDGGPARLERFELPYDALAAAVRTCAARVEAKRVPAHPERIRELERLGRCGERVRHRHVYAGGPVGARARALAAADRLVVGEALVPEGEVVHRPLALRGRLERLAERTDEDVDDAARRLA